QVLFVDTELLKQLKALETELRDVQARQQAVATRLSWDVQPGQSLTLAGKQVSGKNDALLLEDTRIDIPGVGTLDLQPGGSDVAELRREHDRLQDKRSDLLRQLGANSLNQAEQRAEQYRDLKAETDNRQTRLDTLAPDGVDALDAELKLARQKRQQLADELAQLPVQQSGLPGMSKAETAERTARDTLQAAESEQSEFRSALAVAESEQAQAAAEWRTAQQALDAPDRQQRVYAANKQLTDLEAEAQRLEAQRQHLDQQIDAANPDMLQQDVARHEKSAIAMESAAQQRHIDINKLQAALEARGA